MNSSKEMQIGTKHFVTNRAPTANQTPAEGSKFANLTSEVTFAEEMVDAPLIFSLQLSV